MASMEWYEGASKAHRPSATFCERGNQFFGEGFAERLAQAPGMHVRNFRAGPGFFRMISSGQQKPAKICSSLWSNHDTSIGSINIYPYLSPKVLCGSTAFCTLLPDRRYPELPLSNGACEFSPSWIQPSLAHECFICSCTDTLQPKASTKTIRGQQDRTYGTILHSLLCITSIWKAPEGPLHFAELDTLSFLPRSWDVPKWMLM